METTKTPEQWNQPNGNIPVFKVDPIVVLLLSFITCGLYLIYWNVSVWLIVQGDINRLYS